jgi:YgiT-type zinc finger domain-containing protein
VGFILYEEEEKMKCHRCGSGTMVEQVSDLPFKLDVHQVLIVKGTPCFVCESCGEIILSDAVLAVIDDIIEKVSKTGSELDVVSFAA